MMIMMMIILVVVPMNVMVARRSATQKLGDNLISAARDKDEALLAHRPT